MGASAGETKRELRRAGRGAAGVVALMISLVVTACSTSLSTTSTTGTSTSGSSTSSPPAAIEFSVYFVRNGLLGVSRRNTSHTSGVAKAAMTALVAGIDADEGSAGLTSDVPAGTQLLGLTIASGTATVNLNNAFAVVGTAQDELARVAQVVYTLTQFPTVKTVAFEIGGTTPATFASGAVSLRSALGRSDLLGALPPIFVETPAIGDTLHGSVHLSGLANVFEGQFRTQLVDGNGKVLLDQPVHATAGTGTWGTFEATISFSTSSTTSSTLRVYDESAKDGSPIDEVDLHLTAGP